MFHINNVPIVPLGGVLVVEGSEERTFISGITSCRGFEIPISAKSFAWAIVRVVLFVGGLLSLLGVPSMMLGVEGPAAALLGPPLGIALLLVWWLTRRGFSASPARARELLAILDGGGAQLPIAIARQRR